MKANANAIVITLRFLHSGLSGAWQNLWNAQAELQHRFSHHEAEAARIQAQYNDLGEARSALEARTTTTSTLTTTSSPPMPPPATTAQTSTPTPTPPTSPTTTCP